MQVRAENNRDTENENKAKYLEGRAKGPIF